MAVSGNRDSDFSDLMTMSIDQRAVSGEHWSATGRPLTVGKADARP
jgi:hypothetical protein